MPKPQGRRVEIAFDGEGRDMLPAWLRNLAEVDDLARRAKSRLRSMPLR
jgi:hypothetical protein